MKIYINRQPKYGPWGGGAKTLNKLVELLLQKGHSIVYQLQEDIDLIFCMDPRPNNFGENIYHLLQYKDVFKTKIVQRVGDVGTHSKPDLTRLLKETINEVDYVIFPSEWAKKTIGFEQNNCEVIFNSPLQTFFKNRIITNVPQGTPKIVTHHWSTNPKKGFHFYEEFDKYCQLTGEFEFYYIGQKPSNFNIKNYQSPLDVHQLILELPKHDVYLTASEEEAGANHVLEAMASGIPVVYRDTGGSIVEYCNSYGRQYSNFAEMIESIKSVCMDYSNYKRKTLEYSSTIDEVVKKYCRILETQK